MGSETWAKGFQAEAVRTKQRRKGNRRLMQHSRGIPDTADCECYSGYQYKEVFSIFTFQSLDKPDKRMKR
jgi:hypothetical protein